MRRSGEAPAPGPLAAQRPPRRRVDNEIAGSVEQDRPTNATEIFMNMRRREFFSTAALAGTGLMAGTRLAAQETPARGGGPPKPPTYAPKMEMLWKSPDRYPNALEASPEGLWLGDQVSERI